MISIIILSYNTQNLLKNCLNSIFKYALIDYEVIVVDNASTDGSVTMVNELKNSRVRVIENKENIGFAKGCNIGAKTAKGDFLLFLNSDTEFVDTATLETMRSSFDEQTGIVGGLMENKDHSLQRSFGSFYTLPHVAKMLFLGEKGELVGQRLTQTKQVDWVSGGFMMVKRDVFQRVGGFDEKLFMYVEDVEFCYRIKQTGHQVVVSPKAKVMHVGHGSSNRTFAITHIYSGLAYLYKKHRTVLEYVILIVLLYTKALFVIVFGTIMKRPELVSRYRQALASL